MIPTTTPPRQPFGTRLTAALTAPIITPTARGHRAQRRFHTSEAMPQPPPDLHTASRPRRRRTAIVAAAGAFAVVQSVIAWALVFTAWGDGDAWYDNPPGAAAPPPPTGEGGPVDLPEPLRWQDLYISALDVHDLPAEGTVMIDRGLRDALQLSGTIRVDHADDSPTEVRLAVEDGALSPAVVTLTADGISVDVELRPGEPVVYYAGPLLISPAPAGSNDSPPVYLFR